MKHAIAIAALLACGAAQASFTGQFAPGNWTQAPGTGSINVFDANSLSITSGNNNTNTASDTDVTIALPSAGTVSFSWDYSTSDPFGPFWDPFIALEPAINQLTDDNGAVGQSGSRSFSANAGDVIGFRIRTVDNSFGSATVRITNFAFDDGGQPAPEPGSLALIAAAMVAAGAIRRRRAASSDA